MGICKGKDQESNAGEMMLNRKNCSFMRMRSFDKERILFFVCIVLLATTSGCISNAKIIQLNKSSPTTFSAAALNGNYSNTDTVSKNFFPNETLWDVLYDLKFSLKRDTTKYTNHASVNLIFDGKHTLTASIIEKGSTLNTIVLDAKVVDDFLCIKRKLFLLPIPMCFFYIENKAILAINNDHSLHVVFQNKTFAMVFAMAGSNDIKRNQTHSRIETEH
jgi:hypothetical protein